MLSYSIIKTPTGSWLFSWSVSSGTYDIWYNGGLLITVATESYEATIPGYSTFPPPLDIVDQGDDVESETYLPFLALQWKGMAEASTYIIEYFSDDNDAWVRKDTVAETGKEYYMFYTPVLADVTQARWRVTARNEVSDGGTPIEFTSLVVRNSDIPIVTFSIDGGQLTIAEG